VTAAFAGLLTKIGVYAIIRVETVIFPGAELNPALMVLALLTMVVGALGAVAQADIKRILSFTLVSHIGYMILGVALGTVAGTAAAIFYIVHHIVVQTTLFLAAGLVEREAGSTSITKIGGLLASAPLVAVLFFIPALNLGGIPPFSGFIGKLGLFQAAAEQGDALAYVLIGAGALVSLLTLYTLVRVWNLAFWRPAGDVEGDETRLLRIVEEAPLTTGSIAVTKATPRLMTLSTGAMVAVGIALTVFAGPLYAVSDRAAQNLDGPEPYIQLLFPDFEEGVAE
jgi:multicomponent Na+:H+ antiporter subunit D